MTRIAQISDLHLVEDRWQERGRAERLRLSLVNFMRRPDPAVRRERALAALDSARHADHVVVTGDLTDDGTDPQFEVLAEVLADSRIDPRRVTLVGGNHDGYSDARALDRALDGPLAAFKHTSGRGAFTVLDDVVIVPLSTVVYQPITSSSGRIVASELAEAKATLDRTVDRRRCAVLALHHSPVRSWFPVVQAIDGLDNAGETERMLEQQPTLFAVHGHVHRRHDRTLRRETRPRVFSSDAVAADASHLRLYHADAGELVPFDEAPGDALVPALA